jgi:hypothetical protein
LQPVLPDTEKRQCLTRLAPARLNSVCKRDRPLPGSRPARVVRTPVPPPDETCTQSTKQTYGFSQKETENENQQAQAQETHEGEPPQEAFALQVLIRDIPAE